MNVEEMIKNVNAECHPITNIDGIITRWLDRGQKIIASKKAFSWMRVYAFELTTTAEQESYALSPFVNTGKIITFYDTETPQAFRNMTEQEFRQFEPGPESVGTPYIYRLVGFSPVQNQPTSASVLTFASDSGLDTSHTINVAGWDDNDVWQSETVALNGTNDVVSNYAYKRVKVLSKDVTNGNVTCTSNAAAVTNVRMGPGDRYLSHPVVNLYNIPDSTATIYYDFTMRLPDLKAITDISLIPEQYHDAIELYATARVFKHLNNAAMFQLTMGEFNQRVADIIADDKQPSGVWTLNSYSIGYDPPIAQPRGLYPRID